MKDYKEIISKVEVAVKDIKDETLKKIAFERLLEHELLMNSDANSHMLKSSGQSSSPTGEEKETTKKAKKKKSTYTGPFNIDTVRNEVKTAFQDLTANPQGQVPFDSFKQKFEKFLWVLEFGRKKGVAAMTNNEIAFVLSEKLAQPVTDKQVNNLKQKLKDGLVQVWEIDGKKAWKIVQDGINLVTKNTINDKKVS